MIDKEDSTDSGMDQKTVSELSYGVLQPSYHERALSNLIR